MAPLTAEVYLHVFITLALMERRAKNLRPGRLNAIGRAPVTPSKRRCGDPTVCLDNVEDINSSVLPEVDNLFLRRLACNFTD
jgi:hypothetical protein